MRRLVWSLPLLLAACNAGNQIAVGGDAGGNGADGGISSSSSALSFGVFGDCRPGSPGDTAGYPSAVVAQIFGDMQAKNLQFAVGTGDYMFANTQLQVRDQVGLLLAAQKNFTGPVFPALGNHECDGATASNCPNANETENIRGFMTRLMPAGITTAYYRKDFDTPHGKAKFLFVAANSWSPAQASWLTAQLADPTAYTFVIRHEPAGTTAPGVSPSEAIISQATITLQLMGHYHEYRRYDSKHVISGNGGAPVRSGETAGFGYLWIEQLDDGNIVGTEIDATSNSPTDTWKISPSGQTVM